MNRPSDFKWRRFALSAALVAAAYRLLSGCSYHENTHSTPLPKTAAYNLSNPNNSGAHAAQFDFPRRQEIWLLARGDMPPIESSATDPGSGALLARRGALEIPMPLRHTDVRASVSGFIGAVDVTQQFQNPYSEKIEAVYIFPLPHDAAVSEFILTIGDRQIRGIIRERKEAEALYVEARRQGYVASLLTEERPNVFRQSIANLEPGKEIEVNIHYLHTLPYADGWYEFVFPMVVGPRFNPPGLTNGVGAVARDLSGSSGQPVETHYLEPGERSAHDISLRVEIDAGTPIEEISCATHDVEREIPAPERAVISLASSDALPNRDFVLRFRVAGDQIKSSFLTHRTDQGNYFMLMLYPPKELGNLRRQPLEMVFVLDCSGSMYGRPIQQAKAAVERGLRLLQPGDSFQVISFSMTASRFGQTPVPATPENIGRAIQYVRSLNGEGGTMMLEGIRAALDFPHDPQRLRFVCFLTDGYIGNETEIIQAIHQRLGASRIFSFGIGASVNRYLIEQMGATGRGAVAYLGLRDEAPQIMEDFVARISHPALTDLSIDWGGAQVTDIFTRQVPDLFSGRQVALAGRFTGEPPDTVRITGQAAGRSISVDIPTASSGLHPGLPSIWARMEIADLAQQAIYRPDAEWPEQIKAVALNYGLLSALTAFVAVDSTHRTEAGENALVPVAVPAPQGVNYKNTVPSERRTP